MDTPVLPLSRIEAVVIGASAGGVDALLTLLTALPAGFRPAVLVVIHVPPDQPSGIAALLDQRCALPVTEALDKQPVPSGAVVFAPPNYHLLVEPTRTLALSIDAPVRYSRPAIDPLFESASIAYGAQLLALLLTGGSDDGSEGLAAVRARRHGLGPGPGHRGGEHHAGRGHRVGRRGRSAFDRTHGAEPGRPVMNLFQSPSNFRETP